MSLLAALIFAAHPIQTQAVTYTIQRYASMAAMFYMASVFFYLKARIMAKNSPVKQASRFTGQAKLERQGAKSGERGAGSLGHGAGSLGHGARSKERRAESKKRREKEKKRRARSKERRSGSTESKVSRGKNRHSVRQTTHRAFSL